MARAGDPNIGEVIDEAMAAIEYLNPIPGESESDIPFEQRFKQLVEVIYDLEKDRAEIFLKIKEILDMIIVK